MANPKHGTWNMYCNYGCRCEPCKHACVVYHRARRLDVKLGLAKPTGRKKVSPHSAPPPSQMRKDDETIQRLAQKEADRRARIAQWVAEAPRAPEPGSTPGRGPSSGQA